MDTKGLLLLITTGANLGLAFFIYLKDSRNKINIYFSLMLFFIAAWSFGIEMFRLSVDQQSLLFWNRLNYISAIFIAVSYYYFARNFPFITGKAKRIYDILNIFGLVAMTLMIAIFGTINSIEYNANLSHFAIINPWNYAIYTVYFSLYILLSFMELARKSKGSSAFTRRLIFIVFGSTAFAAFFGSLFNLFIPIFSYQYVWAGPLSTAIMVFIIVKYLFIKTPE